MLAKLTPAIIVLAIGAWLETEQLAAEDQLVEATTPVTIVSGGRMAVPHVTPMLSREPRPYLPMNRANVSAPGKQSSTSAPSTFVAPEHRVGRSPTSLTGTSLTHDEIKSHQIIQADIARLKAAGIGTP